mmetsp:Transcript_12592/g.18882  ORF Transcript_12592/g.18882 Transcript_12592/m.18882 type:complete len:97 (+) Transcript_12592:23-313(+)
MADMISYSDKYYDDVYEYRHVILPKKLEKQVPKTKLLTEYEWRSLGIRMSRGWNHYAHHKPEPNILLFRRRVKGTNPRLQEEAKISQYQQQQQKMH